MPPTGRAKAAGLTLKMPPRSAAATAARSCLVMPDFLFIFIFLSEWTNGNTNSPYGPRVTDAPPPQRLVLLYEIYKRADFCCTAYSSTSVPPP